MQFGNLSVCLVATVWIFDLELNYEATIWVFGYEKPVSLYNFGLRITTIF